MLLILNTNEVCKFLHYDPYIISLSELHYKLPLTIYTICAMQTLLLEFSASINICTVLQTSPPGNVSSIGIC